MNRHCLAKSVGLCMLIAAICFCTTTAVNADTISLSENWYVRITDFYLFSPTNTDFSSFTSYKWSTTTLIEPKLMNQSSTNPDRFKTALFDFHAGQALTNDFASFCPHATVGSTWGGEMSFRWEIYCTDPRLVFFAASGGSDLGSRVWWTAPAGTGYRTGTATFHASTWGPSYAQVPPSLVVQFTPVPEPTTLSSVIGCLVCAACFFKKRRVDS